MFYRTMHQKHLRLFGGVLGQLLAALSINLFIVPIGLYSGGTIGLCQMVRTLLVSGLHLDFGNHDIAGILYFLSSIPILIFAYRSLGRGSMIKTVVCILSYSLFSYLIPIPAVPIIDDYLTACLLGGIVNAVGSGITLTCGCSSGGLETIGLCLSKRGSQFTVGKVSLTFNAVLYAICFVAFVPEILIYSVIYNFVTYLMLDRTHQQNVSVLALIFTRGDEQQLSRYIMEELGRGVTYWSGTGAYTEEGLYVLCVCLSKFEIEELHHAVCTADPHAFIVVQEGVRVYGNFTRKME